MFTSTHLPTLSSALLLSEGGAVNHTVISSVLALLGWQDKSSAITHANDAEHTLANNLQATYADYLAQPTQSSASVLNTTLTAVIEKLEKDRITATRLATEAHDRLHQRTVDYSGSGVSDFIGGLTTKLATTFFGSDNVAKAEHYEQLASKYDAQLQELLSLRNSFQRSLTDTRIIERPTNHRHLLETSSFELPATKKRFCYPTGRCDLTALSNGYSGFVLKGVLENGDVDQLGSSISSAGDINGDGISDIIIGAYSALSYAGRSYVVFGTSNISAWGSGVLDVNSLMDGQRGFVLQGDINQASSYSGYSVSTAGDINGDGLSDLIVGAYGASSFRGKTYVVFGTRNSTAWGNGIVDLISLANGQRGFLLEGESVSDTSGISVNTAGDVNGDGVSDFIVGAPGALSGAGKSYVMFGTRNSSAWGNGILNISSLMNGRRGFMLQGQADYKSGCSVNTAGDVNGDGVSDIILGAYNFTNGAGATYVMFGSNISTPWLSGTLGLNNILGQQGFMIKGTAQGDWSGWSVSTAGDMNGDGAADFIVGAPLATPGGIGRAGKSYVVFGSNSSLAWYPGALEFEVDIVNGQRGFVLQGEESNDSSGWSVSPAGDINSDGLSDIIVGAYAADPSLDKQDAGKSYIIFGSNVSTAWGNGVLNLADLTDSEHGFVLEGEVANDGSGVSVSSAGDINGDGAIDIIVGAPSALFLAGKTYVVFGIPPLYFSANFLTISTGETIQINSQMLALAGNYPGININVLRVSIENIENGYFVLSSAPSIRLTGFYMQNITDQVVQFVHTGGGLAPQYRIVVDARPGASLGAIYSEAQVNFLGYRPNLVNNQLNVNQGLTTLLGSNDLSASDQDNTAGELSFIISNLAHGQFTISISNATTNSTVSTTRFTGQDVLDRKIKFLHDGSRNVPSYVIAMTDGKSTTPNQTALITFNYAPEMNVTSSQLFLDQGQATILNPRDMKATDVETFVDDIIIYTTNVSAGYFSYTSNPNVSIPAFKQFSLITGGIQFVQDRSEATPTFALCASDGVLNSTWQIPKIYLNHRPLLQGSVSHQRVTQGDDFSFELPPNLFSDPDVNDALTYQAQLAGDAPLPVGLTFTSPRSFAGNLPTVDNYNITVEARDPRGLTASTSFILTSEESKAAYYRAVYSSLSGVAGTAVAVLAYLWLRRRIAKHRRDFPFANDLRKTLNLEYYDFTRFDGDAYKTKVNDFLQQLQSDYDQFYTQLTPQEQKSFAVCVAEILTVRDLVSRSGYGGGLFGVLCCLNVGWPAQLNLKAFEAQHVEIAAEAVAAWKKTTGYQLRPMSELETKAKKTKDTIYIQMEGDTLNYTVIDQGVKRGGEQGVITAEEIGLTTLPATVDELKHYLPKILEITLQRGHTRSDKALREWPYYSPSLKEKAKVFFCCAKPSTAGMFAASRRRSQDGVELENLKKHEGADSVLEIKEGGERKRSASDVESRMRLLLEEHAKTTTTTMDRNMETFSKKIETMSQKIEALEENRPLLRQGK